jgi:hypothetical protein
MCFINNITSQLSGEEENFIEDTVVKIEKGIKATSI